jgi:hypothetical protein
MSNTFSNQRFGNCSPTVDAGFVKLTSDCFCGNWVFEMNVQFCSPATRVAVVVWFFETILLNVRLSLSINVDYPPLFLFAGVVFLRFVYADVTLENVALDTPNTSDVAVSITDAPDKRASTICPISKWGKSHIFRFFHADCHSKQSLIHWYEHYGIQTNERTFSFANWSSFSVANTSQSYSSIS